MLVFVKFQKIRVLEVKSECTKGPRIFHEGFRNNKRSSWGGVSDIEHKWELMNLKVCGYTLNLQAEKLKVLDSFFQLLKKNEAVRAKSILVIHTG